MRGRPGQRGWRPRKRVEPRAGRGDGSGKDDACRGGVASTRIDSADGLSSPPQAKAVRSPPTRSPPTRSPRATARRPRCCHPSRSKAAGPSFAADRQFAKDDHHVGCPRSRRRSYRSVTSRCPRNAWMSRKVRTLGRRGRTTMCWTPRSQCRPRTRCGHRRRECCLGASSRKRRRS